MSGENSDSDIDVVIKKCRKCNSEKEITEFYKDKNGKDGHKNICKECQKCSRKQSYAENKNKSTVSDVDKLRRLRNAKVKKLLNTNEMLVSCSLEEYKKFRNDVALALAEMDFVIDTYREDIVCINVTTNTELTDVLDFEVRTNVSNSMANVIRDSVQNIQIIPNDIEVEKPSPRNLIFRYTKEGHMFSEELSTSIRRGIRNLGLQHISQVH